MPNLGGMDDMHALYAKIPCVDCNMIHEPPITLFIWPTRMRFVKERKGSVLGFGDLDLVKKAGESKNTSLSSLLSIHFKLGPTRQIGVSIPN